MPETQLDVAGTLVEVAAALRAAADELDRAAEILAERLPSLERTDSCPLLIDRDMFKVRWNGATCVLRNTISFRLLERLARRPNHYVTHDQLRHDIWDGPRSTSAISSAVNQLRTRLTAAGMPDLAYAIDGSNAGHYGLMLSSRS